MNPTYLTLILAPAALVAAADVSLSPEAARELDAIERAVGAMDISWTVHPEQQIHAAMSFGDEFRDVIARYRSSGEARYASQPHGITLLHLACLYCRPALLRELLAAGADPNASLQLAADECSGGKAVRCMQPMEACMVSVPDSPARSVATVLPIIETLHAAGADMKGTAAANVLLKHDELEDEDTEAFVLRLLELGADPRQATTETWTEERRPGAVFLLSLASCNYQRAMERTLKAGLSHPDEREDVDSVFGYVAMYCAGAEEDGSAEYYAELVEAMLTLLRHGADSQLPGTDGRTPADHIHTSPKLVAYLREQGFEIPRTPRQLRRGQLFDDLVELPWWHVCPPLETLAPLYEDMAAILRKPRRHPQDIVVCGKCLALMAQVDAARTAEIFMALPQWQETADWEDGNRGVGCRLTAALAWAERLLLPADWLRARADALHEAGYAGAAHDLLFLLWRDRDAGAIIEELCADPRPAIAAAAWRARLKQADIITASSYNLDGHGDAAHALGLRLAIISQALRSLPGDGMLARRIIASDEACLPFIMEQDLAQLTDTLRQYGEGSAAEAIAELCELQAQSRPSGNVLKDIIRAAASDEAERHLRRRQLDEKLQAERLLPLNYAIQKALAKMLWEEHVRKEAQP